MEENAHLTFKVPPPGIEFTLPSPKIGIESLPVVDPPWMLEVKTKVEEVTISQESHVSCMNVLMYIKLFYDNVQLSFQAVAMFYVEAVYNISVYILDTIS
jgi:hypothetical protein